MEDHKIEPHKITKPIQLMAVWFVALFFIDAAFLTGAVKIDTPSWAPATLVISAVCFVPLFMIGVFLMQTKFRKELQEDHYYSKMLEKKEKTFQDFSPENLAEISNVKSSTRGDLESERVKRYEEQRGLFLVHSWRPSKTPGQVADIVIWLHQHGTGPMSQGLVEKVEYELGPKFFDAQVTKSNIDEKFRIEISAYGPLLCLAKVYLKDGRHPIILERYIDFD